MKNEKEEKSEVCCRLSELAYKILMDEIDMMQQKDIEINNKVWVDKRYSAISEACFIYQGIKANLSDK